MTLQSPHMPAEVYRRANSAISDPALQNSQIEPEKIAGPNSPYAHHRIKKHLLPHLFQELTTVYFPLQNMRKIRVQDPVRFRTELPRPGNNSRVG